MSSTDPRLLSGPSSHSQYPALDLSHNDSASRSQAGSLLGNIQSGGLEDGSNARGLSIYPLNLSTPRGHAYPLTMPNMPSPQLQSCDPASLPLQGLSLTHPQAPNLPFSNQADRPHADSRGTNQQVLLPSTMISSVLPPPLAESQMQVMQGSGVHDDHADASSIPREQVEDTTPNRLTRRVRDMLRKRMQRFRDRQEFRTICGILGIPAEPKNDLVYRIRVRLQELANLGIERQRQLEERETTTAAVWEQLAQISAALDRASVPGINSHTYLGGSDTGATGVHGSMEREPDEWHG